MTENPTGCTAVDIGAECVREATMINPVPLCDEHQLQVALLVVPDVLATALRQAGTDVRPISLPPEERAAVIAGARPVQVGPYMGGVHGSVVYFVENGDRVKIGHSTNLRNRIRAFSLQEKDIMLLLQGGLTLERALHATFAKERIDATEWFVKSERIIAFVDSKLKALDVQSKRPTQPRRVKRVPRPSASLVGFRRTLDAWATLALPLYERFATDVGRPPTAPELSGLLVSAGHAALKPSRARDVRAAVAKLVESEGGHA